MIGLFRTAPLLLCWVGCFCLARQWAARSRLHPDWRLSWVLACIAWGTLVTILTEVLSLVRQLTVPVATATWWGLAGVLLGWAMALARGQRAGAGPDRRWPLRKLRMAAQLRAVASGLARLPFDVLAVWAVVVALVALLGWIALDFPTTTGDSLTYHLARIMHWIQQEAVAHYPTHNCRQNELGPWAEYVLTHLHLLWGNDRLLNVVQWFAMVSSLIGGTWIADQLLGLLGGPANQAGKPSDSSDRSWAHSIGSVDPARMSGTLTEPATALGWRLAALTALLIVSVPIGIVEAVTTQNDYVTTFWLVGLTSLALALIRTPAHWVYLVGAGLAFALGTLTKATLLVYAAPLLVALAGWLALRRLGGRVVLVFGLTFLLINAGHMARNYALVGSPLAGPYIHKLVRNDTLSLSGTWSNLIRNLALATPTPFPPINRAVNWVLAWLHGLSGRGLNDPDITYELCLFSWPEELQIYDSQASNPLHLLAIVVAVAVLVGSPTAPRPGNPQHAGQSLPTAPTPSTDRAFGAGPSLASPWWAVAYVGLFIASFVLFCALLRWQEWHSRFHLAYLVVLMPWVAVVFLTRIPAWATGVMILLAIAQAGYVLARNESRPLLDPTFTQIPREQQYMAIHMPHRIPAYLRACDALARAGVRHVGLKLQYADFEYPLWIMLRNRGFTGRLDHVYVEDVSAKLRPGPVQPEVVLTTFEPPPAAVTKDYPLLRNYGYITLCWPAPAAATR